MTNPEPTILAALERQNELLASAVELLDVIAYEPRLKQQRDEQKRLRAELREIKVENLQARIEAEKSVRVAELGAKASDDAFKKKQYETLKLLKSGMHPLEVDQAAAWIACGNDWREVMAMQWPSEHAAAVRAAEDAALATYREVSAKFSVDEITPEHAQRIRDARGAANRAAKAAEEEEAV